MRGTTPRLWAVMLALAAEAGAEAPKPFSCVSDLGKAGEYRKAVGELLEKADFAAIDAKADELRKSRERSCSGRFELDRFYRAFEQVPVSVSEAAIEKWKKTSPDSVAMIVVAGLTHLQKAKNARGTGLASTVTAQGARIFEEESRRAMALFKAARLKVPGDVSVGAFVLRACGGVGCSMEEIEDIVVADIKVEPDNPMLYINAGIFMLPRWFGDGRTPTEGIERLARKVDDVGYAWVMGEVAETERGDIEAYPLSWKRLKAGYSLLMDKYPESSSVAHHFAFFACREKDKKVARPLLARLEWNDDGKAIWGAKELFEQCRSWAK